MRILHIAGTESYVPSLTASSIQVMKMAGAFAGLGHQVTLLTPRAPRHCCAIRPPARRSR